MSWIGRRGSRGGRRRRPRSKKEIERTRRRSKRRQHALHALHAHAMHMHMLHMFPTSAPLPRASLAPFPSPAPTLLLARPLQAMQEGGAHLLGGRS